MADERREFWLKHNKEFQPDDSGFKGNQYVALDFPWPEYTKQIHTAEIKPGESVISKEKLREKLGNALGYGSLCWTETPKGIFESTNAAAFVDAMIQELFGSEGVK